MPDDSPAQFQPASPPHTPDAAVSPPSSGSPLPASLGPSQLAGMLHAPVASLYRARELDLIPGPGPDGRWAAEATAVIERDWPRIVIAIEAARELGAARSAELLGRLTGLPVSPGHVAELAARGLLTSSGSYKHRPLYRVADLQALAAGSLAVALLAEITGPPADLSRR